ncbi:MAG: polymer-forming cytoskeletal protein [Deltaproteobacteria bacterium]|jgi:cytoskeletal protein CcmA (bactofilin family)|nr:polymer-forming cytoskeletal protein [Deltaproteobacteria bacterium]
MFGKTGDKKNIKPGKQVWNAFFANSVEIEGSLRFSGLLNIDGRLTGAIVAKGMLVTGVNARVVGDIFVENLILSGTVIGNIFATGEVHLNQTAQVTGNIHYNTLSIVPGAVHEGNSHLFSEKERLTLLDKIQAELAAPDAHEALPERPPLEVAPPPRKNLESPAPHLQPTELLAPELIATELVTLDQDSVKKKPQDKIELATLREKAS